MRKKVHNDRLHIAVNDALVGQMKMRAEQRGMTLPEWVRQALRRELEQAA